MADSRSIANRETAKVYSLLTELRLQFIHNVNGEGSKTAKSLKGDITQHHVDFQAM